MPFDYSVAKIDINSETLSEGSRHLLAGRSEEGWEAISVWHDSSIGQTYVLLRKPIPK
jgi:hypothetical protein